MTEYTRDTMPPVPEGKVRLAQGRTPEGLDADRTIVAQAPAALHGCPIVTIAHETRGYVSAGSCARWQEAQWAVTYCLSDNTTHGQRFLESDETGARAYFARLTDSQAVSAIRQRAAQCDDERREAETRAALVAVEVAKTYRSGWQWRAPSFGIDDFCGFAKTKPGAVNQARAAITQRILAA